MPSVCDLIKVHISLSGKNYSIREMSYKTVVLYLYLLTMSARNIKALLLLTILSQGDGSDKTVDLL